MHDFMLEMEDNDMNVILPFGDWEGLVDASEFSMGGFMMNHVFSDSENAGLDDHPPSPEVECKASIAERRAAKFGFDDSRINVAKFKRSSSPNSSPARSPYLTIPPGISPAALLDSPVMLPNAEAQPSPTTGTLQFQESNNDGFLVPNSSTSHNVDRDKGSSIPISVGFTAPSCSTAPMLSCASSAENKIPTTLKSPMDSAIEDAQKICARDTSTDAKVSGKMARKNPTNTMKFQLPQLRNVKQEENQAAYNLTDVSRNAEDGYSWRKYGQKHVKGSEYPRSYYKCNNSSCSVKKTVERSHNGDITEIIYKGLHNHPKTHPRISLTPPAPSVELMETGEGSVKVENGTNPNIQLKNKDPRIGLDWRPDGLDTTFSNSVSNDALDPLAAAQGKSPSPLGSGELASRRACQDGEEDDGVTQGNTFQGDEADESESKRRKKEMFSAEAYLPSRSNREPRVIVKIETEIDVLDDGYRWRKYGQKVVKGNPNPRSYYKCTSAGCPVRKHVERASEDIKTVLTTYEGKHNHEVPTSKTSGLHSTFNSPPDGSNSAVSRNPNIATREIKVQGLPPHYEMKPEFLRSNFLGDFGSDIQIGPPSLYPMKFPPTPSLQTSMPFSPYMMNGNGGPAMLDFPMSIPLNGPRSSPNMPLNNTFQHPYNHNNHVMQNGTAMQTSIGDQSMKDGDLRFLRPKEEKRDETLSVDTCMTAPENSNVASSTPFCMVMGNFPS